MKTFVNLPEALVALAIATGCSGPSAKQASQAPGTPAPVSAPAYNLATEVQGLPATKDGTVHASSLSLSFDLAGQDKDAANLKLQGFECRVAPATDFKPCASSPLMLGNLTNGALVDIAVRAVVQDQTNNILVYAAEVDIHLTVVLDGSESSLQALSNALQVGSAYQMTVPVGLHVTEYSTSKTTGPLSVFRILSDASYLGNYSCSHDWDQPVTSMSPAGEANSYCHSTPTREAYKAEQEYRLANNHVEIATDVKLVTPEAQERMSVSVFDADYELITSHSRFANLCSNSDKRQLTVPMLPNFFLETNPTAVNFWICDAIIPDNTGAAQQWRVGAFFSVQDLDFKCQTCTYDSAVEMVYMARVDADDHLDANFAKIAQQRLLNVLTKLTP